MIDFSIFFSYDIEIVTITLKVKTNNSGLGKI